MIRNQLWILAGLLLAGTANAQPAQIQGIRPTGAEDLNRYLARLGSNPRDVDALIGAGDAALAMDDAHAAAGFFARADGIQPNNGRVKAGLARVMLSNQNPAGALRLFNEAARLGVPESSLQPDRALAYDMTGDQASAQRDYQAALHRTPDDAELIRRYAASLGISGQVDAAEKVLGPLLYKSDRAAWRYRAFIFAMNNKQQEARKVAQQTMPGPLAAALLPYMEKMPYLTAAQKAAAVHFGHFPATVGTRIAAVTPTPAPSSVTPAPFAATAPSYSRAQPAQRPTVPSRPMTSTLAPPTATTVRQATTPAQAAAPTTQRQPISPAPQSMASASQSSAASSDRLIQGPPADIGMPSAMSSSATRPSGNPQGSMAIGQPAPTAAASPAPSPTPATPAAAVPTPRQQPNPEATRTLADIIRAIDVPDSERQPSVAAVDLTEIQAMQAARRAERQAAADKAKKAAAAKAKAEADAKAKKEADEKARLAANPSRNWLQIGTGQDRGALAFTLKAMRKKYDSLAPQDGWAASWGRTNRLLVGPFASFTRAKNLEADLKKAGADVFAWKSEAGEVVERVGAK